MRAITALERIADVLESGQNVKDKEGGAKSTTTDAITAFTQFVGSMFTDIAGVNEEKAQLSGMEEYKKGRDNRVFRKGEENTQISNDCFEHLKDARGRLNEILASLYLLFVKQEYIDTINLKLSIARVEWDLKAAKAAIGDE